MENKEFRKMAIKATLTFAFLVTAIYAHTVLMVVIVLIIIDAFTRTGG